jgi:hypothetical protein
MARETRGSMLLAARRLEKAKRSSNAWPVHFALVPSSHSSRITENSPAPPARAPFTSRTLRMSGVNTSRPSTFGSI